MPTYDYVCDACDYAFEEFHSMTAPALKTCPECKKNALRRLIGTGAGIIFKGSGFYETDYKKKTPTSSSDNATSSSQKTATSKSDK